MADEHLHRDVAPELRVRRQVDDSLSALPDQAHDQARDRVPEEPGQGLSDRTTDRIHGQNDVSGPPGRRFRGR